MHPKQIYFILCFIFIVFTHSDAAASPKAELIENIIKFFSRGAKEVAEESPIYGSIVAREGIKIIDQEENFNEVKNGLSADYLLSHMQEGQELDQLKSKLKGNSDCPQFDAQRKITNEKKFIKNLISMIVSNQSPEEVRRVWQSVRNNKSLFFHKNNNGHIVGEISVYVFGATENCAGLVSVRVLNGKTTRIEDELIASFPDYQLMNDICTPRRISWMKNYGYKTEDYLLNSQFKIISSNVIGYEQCVSDDLQFWREDMAKTNHN